MNKQYLSKKIFFFNDRSGYNSRYRSDLMNSLPPQLIVESVGWQDTPISFTCGLFSRKSLGFSSNAKSNILVLIFRFFPAVVLFNGLGRFRRFRLFRLVLILLISRREKNIIIFQNYLDYRFFRRYTKKEVFWVPGSGGVCRWHPAKNRYGTVTRADKLMLCRSALDNILTQDFVRRAGSFKIVGVDSHHKSAIDCDRIDYKGYVPQDDLFSCFSTFVQLPGYGEGIPHSLVDAVVSNMRVVISKKQFIEFGLYKLGFGLSVLGDDWFELLCFEKSEKVSITHITPKYIDAIERLRKLK